LFRACRRGDPDTVIAILAADPELVHKTDKNLRTPLHLAAQVGSVTIVKTLLAFSPDISAENEHGDTAEDMARRFGPFIEVILLLQEYARQMARV